MSFPLFPYQGFTLEFHFEANEFFTNPILTKSYQMGLPITLYVLSTYMSKILQISSMGLNEFYFLSFFKNQGFTLEFHFEANEYFTNTVLTKSYQMKSEPDEGDPFSFEGPEIVGSQG